MQRLRDILGEIQNVVEAIDQRVNRSTRKRRQQRAPDQGQRVVDDGIGALFKCLDFTHAAIGVTHVRQQLR